jgi:hypothetical protein
MNRNTSVFSISREAYNLLANTAGNNGRALRRFLSRETIQGSVHQAFTAYDEEVSKERYLELSAIARATHEQNLYYIGQLDGVAVKRSIGTCLDEMFRLVQNSYELHLDLATASVKEMRRAVQVVAVLSDNLHAHLDRTPVSDDELAFA